MAKQDHLEILSTGVEEWNKWRALEPEIEPDLSGANMPGEYLHGINLKMTNLAKANLKGSNLENAELYYSKLDNCDCSEAYLTDANLTEASLINANFTDAHLYNAVLRRTNSDHAIFKRAILGDTDFSQSCLKEVDFAEAKLENANLSFTDLTRANFQKSGLREVNFARAILTEAYFDECEFGNNIFADVDFSNVFGLETAFHYGPSTLDLQTLGRSGTLSLKFLRGCGLSDGLIDYLPSLLNKPFEFYSCFISYSAKDSSFAKRLYADLQDAGVRCWFAPEDMKIGDKIRDRIDQSIKVYEKLLIILSRNSIYSTWVEKEVETAFDEERKRNTTVLFPIRLDNDVMTTNQAWAADIKRTRHIGEFNTWKDHDAYQVSLERLLRDLRGADSKVQSKSQPSGIDDDIPF